MTHVMIVQVTIRPSIKLVATDMLQQFHTFPTHEALWMPALAHGADDTANDRISAAGADDGRGRVDTGSSRLRGQGDRGCGRGVKGRDGDGRESSKDDFGLVADTD